MEENNNVSTEMMDEAFDSEFETEVVDDDMDLGEEEEVSEDNNGEADTSEEDPADHSEESEAEAEPDETETKPEEKAEADHSFKLKYMGEEKEFSREETIALAQKGMDYDRIKGKLDALAQKGMDYDRIKGKLDESAEITEFVNNLAKDMNLTVADFMTQALAGNLAKKENISLDEAKRKIELDRREKALAAKEAEAEAKQKETNEQNARVEKARAEVAEFAKLYPDVDVRNIPKEVYQNAANKQISLTAAYALHEAAQAKAALEAEKQNAKNKERSVGSSSSSGKHTPADDFDDIWD